MSSATLPDLPEHYDTPELIVFGELRQMIRGSGSPTSADFSSLDNDINAEPDVCLNSPAADGNELPDSDCENYAPF